MKIRRTIAVAMGLVLVWATAMALHGGDGVARAGEVRRASPWLASVVAQHGQTAQSGGLPVPHLACGIVLLSADAPPDPAAQVEPGLLRQLKELDARLEKIDDMRARFTQVKHVSLLKEPLTSRGSILVKGPLMRWDVTAPTASTTLTSAKEIRIHYPREKLVEVYRIDERLAAIVASPLPRLPVMLRYFTLERRPAEKGDKEGEHLRLRLTPRTKELSEHLARVEVVIDLGKALAKQMEMVDPDGDRTVVTFEEIEANVGLKDQQFELTLPPGTRVVRPLEAKE